MTREIIDQLINDITLLHAFVSQKYGGSPGVISSTAIEAAAARPYTAFGGVELYPTPFSKAAALTQTLLQRHAFVDGNKRTALAACIHLLKASNFVLQSKPAETTQSILNLVTKITTQDDFAKWLKVNSLKSLP